MKPFLIAWVAGLSSTGMTWGYYRWGGDHVAALVGPIIAFGIGPLVLGAICVAAVSLLFGEKPVHLLRTHWYWLPVPLILSYLPLLLWMWGTRHDS
jgi:hypothetical protein